MEEKKTRRSGREIISRKAFSPEPIPAKERKKSENGIVSFAKRRFYISLWPR